MSDELQHSDPWIQDLRKSPAWLKMDLRECGSVQELLDHPADENEKKTKQTAFAVGLSIRVAEYHDINPAMLIYDAQGGTLGFVQKVTPSESAIREAIDNAVCFRQIALELATAGTAKTGKPVLALQVEFVLVTDDELAVSRILSDLARKTGYLRLVGISILKTSSFGSEADLRRAFPWLLKSTGHWFEKHCPVTVSSPWRQIGDNFTLQLTNYRLRGQRNLTCDARANLHLLHGHNGSGKSTFTEALEFVATGQIERIDDPAAYFATVHHRYGPQGQKTSEATVAFLAGPENAQKSKVRVTEDNKIHREPVETIPLQAKSFRLDSTFMEKLARANSVDRALLFLDAFTPGGSKAWQSGLEERNKLRDDMNALPAAAHAPTNIDDGKLADWLAREYSDENGNTPLFEATLLPLAAEDLDILARVYPALPSAVSALRAAKTASALTGAAAQIDSVFTALRANLANDQKSLQTTHNVFTEFRNWVATGQTERGTSFETDLNDWLDLQVLVDLNAKYVDIASTLADAQKLGWQPSPEESALLPSGPFSDDLLSRLRARANSLTTDLNQARARVLSWQQQPTAAVTQAGSPSTPSSESFRSWLTDAEKADLNRAAPWLDALTPLSEPLGDVLARALDQDLPATIGKSVVGSPQGLETAIAEIQKLLRALDTIGKPEIGHAADHLAKMEQIAARAKALQSAASLAAANLFNSLVTGNEEQESLVNAFNELLALFTPARWNYRDLKLATTTGATSLGLSTADGGRADLLLNTAELNAWALAMFLLLACRLPNPMQILVLDDPLQNMDELSVVTLARGLARLMPIFPKGWLILGFFHGEQNVEMIRQENECHVYHLSWLQSRMETVSALEKVEVLSTAPADRQTLHPDWFAEQPRSLAATP